MKTKNLISKLLFNFHWNLQTVMAFGVLFLMPTLVSCGNPVDPRDRTYQPGDADTTKTSDDQSGEDSNNSDTGNSDETTGENGNDQSEGDSGSEETFETCGLGLILDCAEICFIAETLNFWGDGNCDVGSDGSPNFDCEAWLFDDGDCNQTTTPTIGTNSGNTGTHAQERDPDNKAL